MDPRFTELLAPFLRFRGDRVLERASVLRELGLNSMQSIELLFAIEDEFGVTLPDEQMNEKTFATAGSLWDVVHAELRKAQLPEGSA
ncbi:phosphopantetheine-binding protein [Amycolatopsis silviterrae]|uniref:Phosphopantetheine-binding protein n=1 Tax=Amycolatopsis silviterrae TaxID=1656914 RepID=A0ABW5H3X3_9PSEU